MENDITIGMTGEKSTTVSADQTAEHLGSGGLQVYATPAMVSLMEGAAVAAIDPHLPDGYATVGVKISIKHLAPTPLSQQVRAEAEVTEVDRRKITLTVKAYDEHELIGEGTHVRFIIDIAQFEQRVADKLN